MAQLAMHRYPTRLERVPELAVTASRSNLHPPVIGKHPEHLDDLGGHAWFNAAVLVFVDQPATAAAPASSFTPP